MRSEWYRDYMMVPNAYGIDTSSYFVALKFLQTLDRFGVVEVRPCHRPKPHDVMSVWIDGVYYNEILSVWIGRFKNR